MKVTKVLGDVAEVTLVFQPRSSSTDVIGGAAQRRGKDEEKRKSARRVSQRPRSPFRSPKATYHFPRTLIKHFIEGSSAGPAAKNEGKGARTSSRSEVGEMAMGVSGLGSGEVVGLYRRSPARVKESEAEKRSAMKILVRGEERKERTRSESGGRELGSSGSVELERVSVLVDEGVGHGVEVEASREGHLWKGRRKSKVSFEGRRNEDGETKSRTAVTSSGDARKFTERQEGRKEVRWSSKIDCSELGRDSHSLVLRFPSFRALKFLGKKKTKVMGQIELEDVMEAL